MQLRFLRATESARPEFPFQAGQIIYPETLSPQMEQWLRDGSAELVPEELEQPAPPEPRRAVSVPKRKR